MDACYGERDEMGVIFAKEVKAVLPALLHGQNATVFACGATGSGKTYTMQVSPLVNLENLIADLTCDINRKNII